MYIIYLLAAFVVSATTDYLAGKWNGKPTRVGTLSIYTMGAGVSFLLIWKAVQS